MSVVSNSSFSTAAASGGVAGAATVIICWLISLAHVQVPAEVAASFMVVGAPLLHLVAMWLSPTALKEPTDVAADPIAAKPIIVTTP